jgi:hypothetical protein
VAIARIIETRITPAEYDQMRVLLGIGDTPPPGGLFHVAAIGEDGGLRIIEVWDSREEAEAWGEKVMAAREEDRSRQRPAGDRVPRDSQRRSALAGRSALALREPTGRPRRERGAAPRRSAVPADDHGRAGRVVGALHAGRAKQEIGEAAVSA